MKRFRLIFVLLAGIVVSSMILINCKSRTAGDSKAEAVGNNQLTQEEIDDGWVLLFDGKTFDGWRGYGLETFPDSGWTNEWNEMIKESKFPTYNPDWANVAKTGYIALQDHGHAVWFRNIKLKEL